MFAGAKAAIPPRMSLANAVRMRRRFPHRNSASRSYGVLPYQRWNDKLNTTGALKSCQCRTRKPLERRHPDGLKGSQGRVRGKLRR